MKVMQRIAYSCFFRHEPVPFEEMINIFFKKHPLNSQHIELLRMYISMLTQFNSTEVTKGMKVLDKLQKDLDE